MKYTYNKEYLMRDEKPWFPVMGEFHYSRYRDDLWEESLRKMKAGGVTVVSTYAFWIHHEEEEGVYDFTGCRNIGEFLNICKKLDLPVLLRIGPWCHGEVRNGGFPDWLLEKQIPLRCDDPAYLVLARRCYPKLKDLSVLPEGLEACGADQEFTLYRRSQKAENTRVTVMEENRNEDSRIYDLKITSPGTWRDTILSLDFGGDKIEVFRNGEMLTDSYYIGEPVQISLRYFDFPEELQVKIYPLKEGASKFLEHWPQMKDGCACELYVVGVKDLVW